ncbi:MAG: hypothetical protein JXR91_13045 [Deltaproteobacteria bacterium]|nr:hypothetical protein [Deltaproteobacteria bacterium]
MFRFFNVQIISLLLFLSLSSGCSSDAVGSEDLTVSWNISGLSVCKAYLPDGEFAQDEISFDKIVINIYKADDLETPVQDEVVVPCETYNYVFTRLKRDRYVVVIDAKGEYDGKVLPFFGGEQDVRLTSNEEENFADIQLTLAKGTAQIVWQFDGGLTCGIENAGEVDAVSVNFAGSDIEASCGDGMIVIDDVVPGTSYKVKGEALDVKGDVLYNYSSNKSVTVLPGETLKINMDFK